jgi:hypothetical protein
MTNPVAVIRDLSTKDNHYKAIAFCCPGCAKDGGPGLHMLPIQGNIPVNTAQWAWDGNIEAPTLSPSILTRSQYNGKPTVCHSFMRAGNLEFLSDCTHHLAGQTVPLPPLPDWFVREHDTV